MTSLVNVHELYKAYGSGDTQTEVLKGVGLTIQSGEFVAIMGPSGSGKSTLMHILGLLDKPTSGTYELDGVRTDSLSEDRLAELRNLKLGFVFQSFNLLARTSALENVELPLIYNNKFSSSEQRKIAEQALQSVGLSHRLKSFPNQLSGGEQQRVAIARALVSNPQIIFADEPTGNLDTKTSIEIMEILKHLHQQGKTIILVTHETAISKFAERIINIRDGLIINDQTNNQFTDETIS
ncbi:MAG: ABC transporter ATP-binding protein [Patescibacteria group bacterium]